MFRYDEASCCGNAVNFVIFDKSLCLNFVTDSKKNIKIVVEHLCARGLQIMTLETCYHKRDKRA